jgi:hypothetical protein
MKYEIHHVYHSRGNKLISYSKKNKFELSTISKNEIMLLASPRATEY